MIDPPKIPVRRWLSDGTRRFAERPVYHTEDLEQAVSVLLHEFSADRQSDVAFPLSDDDLAKIVEALSSEFDSACDLSYISDHVEGATRFSFDERPIVMVDRRLNVRPLRKRRRMTIAHEIGHILAHRSLFERSSSEMMELFTDLDGYGPVYCLREAIDRGNDWMEWQASYLGGALLMPRDRVLSDVHSLLDASRVKVPLRMSTPLALLAIGHVARRFDVSLEAARVRLIELRQIESHESIQSLPL